MMTPSFLSTTLPLAGVAVAVLPVLLHLVRKRPQKSVDWAAMKFLLAAQRQQKNKLRFHDLVLLFIRVVTILLLGLIAGHLYFQSTEPGAGNAKTAIHQILVLDNSASMGQQLDGADALTVAKIRGHEIVDELPAGCRISVFQSIDQTGESYQLLATTRDKAESHTAIDAATLAMAGNCEASVQRACRDASEWTKGRIPSVATFLTDRSQASSFQCSGDSGLTVEIISLVDQPANNVWIDQVVWQDPAVLAGERFFGEVHLKRSASDLSREELPFECHINGKTIPLQVVFERGSKQAMVRFHDTLGEEDGDGWARYQFCLPDDGLAADNEFESRLPVFSRNDVHLFSAIIIQEADELRRREDELQRFIQQGGTVLVCFNRRSGLDAWNRSHLLSPAALDVQLEAVESASDSVISFAISRSADAVESLLRFPGTSSDEMDSIFEPVTFDWLAGPTRLPEEVRVRLSCRKRGGAKQQVSDKRFPLLLTRSFRTRDGRVGGTVGLWLADTDSAQSNFGSMALSLIADRWIREVAAARMDGTLRGTERPLNSRESDLRHTGLDGSNSGVPGDKDDKSRHSTRSSPHTVANVVPFLIVGVWALLMAESRWARYQSTPSSADRSRFDARSQTRIRRPGS